MPKKIFKYRGHTLEELQAMSMEELAEKLPSRQRRKISRGFTEGEAKLIKKLRADDHVRTHLRGMIVLPAFVGKTIHIHTGQEFKPVEIIPEMIGNYLGELALTRNKVDHNRPGIGATKSSAAVSVR
jgi:small subunit ribosomal protein S19